VETASYYMLPAMLPTMLPTVVGSSLGGLTCGFTVLPMLPTRQTVGRAWKGARQEADVAE